MRRHDTRRLIVISLTLAAALLGCGGGDDQANDREQASSEASGAVPSESPTSGEAARSSAEPAATGEANDFGPPLEHPQRYYGLYANPETPNRHWFVAAAKRPWYAEQAPEVPPGHLSVGAMFGDVEPWHMKTLSAIEFEQARVSSLQPEPVAVRFELDGDGNAVAMSFTDEQMSSEGRLERVGDLPEDFR